VASRVRVRVRVRVRSALLFRRAEERRREEEKRARFRFAWRLGRDLDIEAFLGGTADKKNSARLWPYGSVSTLKSFALN
jgi:hypothetical protein